MDRVTSRNWSFSNQENRRIKLRLEKIYLEDGLNKWDTPKADHQEGPQLEVLWVLLVLLLHHLQLYHNVGLQHWVTVFNCRLKQMAGFSVRVAMDNTRVLMPLHPSIREARTIRVWLQQLEIWSYLMKNQTLETIRHKLIRRQVKQTLIKQLQLKITN